MDYPIKEIPQYQKTMRRLETSDRGHAETFNPLFQQLLDNDNRMAMASVIHFLASGWSETAPFVQTVEAPGFTENDRPIIGIEIPEGTTAEAEKAMKKAAGCISYIDVGANGVTATCLGKKPTADFWLSAKGV